MSSPKSKIASKAMAVAGKERAATHSNRIPAPLRFPLLLTLNFSLSTLLYSLLADFTTAELLSLRRQTWLEVGVLLGWRMSVLALSWYGDFDSFDLASLTLLSHGPSLYLLRTFYEVSSTAVVFSLIIDIFTTYIPFRLLRPVSPAHTASSSSRSSVTVLNKEIVTSTSIQAYTTILGASIYAVTIYASCKTFLPLYLATYFDGIPTIAGAYTADPVALFPLTMFLGLASKSFIFTPSVTTAPSTRDAKASSAFNPETSTLAETFWHNVWGFDERTKVVIQRTATVALVSGVNTFLQTFLTINGVEPIGAAAYSVIFIVANAITGTAFGVIISA